MIQTVNSARRQHLCDRDECVNTCQNFPIAIIVSSWIMSIVWSGDFVCSDLFASRPLRSERNIDVVTDCLPLRERGRMAIACNRAIVALKRHCNLCFSPEIYRRTAHALLLRLLPYKMSIEFICYRHAATACTATINIASAKQKNKFFFIGTIFGCSLRGN